MLGIEKWKRIDSRGHSTFMHWLNQPSWHPFLASTPDETGKEFFFGKEFWRLTASSSQAMTKWCDLFNFDRYSISFKADEVTQSTWGELLSRFRVVLFRGVLYSLPLHWVSQPRQLANGFLPWKLSEVRGGIEWNHVVHTTLFVATNTYKCLYVYLSCLVKDAMKWTSRGEFLLRWNLEHRGTWGTMRISLKHRKPWTCRAHCRGWVFKIQYMWSERRAFSWGVWSRGWIQGTRDEDGWYVLRHP